MREVVFTVVHPETYFFSWDGKDEEWCDLHYGQKMFSGLQEVIGRVISFDEALTLL